MIFNRMILYGYIAKSLKPPLQSYMNNKEDTIV